MRYIHRNTAQGVVEALERGRNILLLGPRQTGKTTLVRALTHHRYLNLMNPEDRLRYESNPLGIISETKALNKQLGIKPIVIVDEIQKLPQITDSIQILIDENIGQFILTGSSARKIKNLLPGRVLRFQLDPLSFTEIQSEQMDLTDLLIYGALPAIRTMDDLGFREQELESYVTLYLKEEVRKEALVRNLGSFSNFLRLASIESGNIINLRSIANEIGVSHTTISEYYRILEDCMLAEKIQPLTHTVSRKRLTKAPKYLIFDLGVRRVAAKESSKPNLKQMGYLFEQLIGLELLKIIRSMNSKATLLFWRDHAGPEIDYVLRYENAYVPIEVKWTSNPSQKDIRHLKIFLEQYPEAKQGYLICQTPYTMALSENIVAISWKDIQSIFTEDAAF